MTAHRDNAENVLLVNDVKQPLVWLAIQRVRVGRRGGSPRAAGLLPDHVLLEACTRHILRGESAESIIDAMGLREKSGRKSAAGKRIRSQDAKGIKNGKVTRTTMAKFLGDVRDAYKRIIAEETKRQAENVENTLPSAANPELMSIQTLTKMKKWVDLEFNDPSAFAQKGVNEQHVVVRATEVIRDAMKILQESRLKAAQTQSIIAKAAQKAYENLPAAARSNVTQQQVIDAFAVALMGEDVDLLGGNAEGRAA